ncbi:hypothetical protein [Microbacterium sp. NPDC055683]
MSAADYVDDAVAGIQGDGVYVSPDVPGAADYESAMSQVVPQDGSIAVVVLPADAGLDAPYATYLLDSLTRQAGYDTVVLAVGSDVQADSVAIDGDEALRIANEAESAAGPDTQTALVETVQGIAEALPAGDGGGSGGIGWPVPVIGGVVLVAAAVTAGALLVRRRRRSSATARGQVPAAIRSRLDRLRALRADYARLGGNRVAAETTFAIDGLVSNTEQLFARLDAKAGRDQVVLAEGEYADKLARLSAALERDYLLDLIVHPELWDDPDQRIAEVRDALAAVSTQIVDNIKQVNARRGLLFQVSLDSLVGRAELRDWEREFKRSSGEG